MVEPGDAADYRGLPHAVPPQDTEYPTRGELERKASQDLSIPIACPNILDDDLHQSPKQVVLVGSEIYASDAFIR